MPNRRKRGRTIRVPEQWLAEVRDFWSRSGKTLAALGADLAPLLGEARPLVPRRVHDYIQGNITTEELTDAFARLMGVDPPILGIEDPDIVQWCNIGRRLKAQTGDVFHEELARLLELVEVLERLRRKP